MIIKNLVLFLIFSFLEMPRSRCVCPFQRVVVKLGRARAMLRYFTWPLTGELCACELSKDLKSCM